MCLFCSQNATLLPFHSLTLSSLLYTCICICNCICIYICNCICFLQESKCIAFSHSLTLSSLEDLYLYLFCIFVCICKLYFAIVFVLQELKCNTFSHSLSLSSLEEGQSQAALRGFNYHIIAFHLQ